MVDYVLCNDRACCRRDAEHVDSRWTGRCRVFSIRMVPGNVVPYDHIIREVLPGCVAVHRQPRQTISDQAIVDDDIRGIPGTRNGVEDSDPRPCPLFR